MRYTKQWFPDGGYDGYEYDLSGWCGTVNPKLVRLVRDKLDTLTREERLLLFQEIACIQEAAYRRGFQQGHLTGTEGHPWRNPSQSEIYSWRYDIPLEFSAPPPGHYRNQKEIYDDPEAFGFHNTSAYRLSIDGGNASPIIDEMAAFGSPSLDELKELCWIPEHEVDRMNKSAAEVQ